MDKLTRKKHYRTKDITDNLADYEKWRKDVLSSDVQRGVFEADELSDYDLSQFDDVDDSV